MAIFYDRKYLQLCVGVPSEVQHDFSSDTVNISGWHYVRKIQKLFFLDIWVMLSEIHFNGNKKHWCKWHPFIKGNPAVLNLYCNPIILNWEKTTSKDWVLLLLSHQAISNAQVFAYVKSWHNWYSDNKARLYRIFTVATILKFTKKKKVSFQVFFICLIDFDALSFKFSDFFLQQLWKTTI